MGKYLATIGQSSSLPSPPVSSWWDSGLFSTVLGGLIIAVLGSLWKFYQSSNRMIDVLQKLEIETHNLGDKIEQLGERINGLDLRVTTQEETQPLERRLLESKLTALEVTVQKDIKEIRNDIDILNQFVRDWYNYQALPHNDDRPFVPRLMPKNSTNVQK